MVYYYSLAIFLLEFSYSQINLAEGGGQLLPRVTLAGFPRHFLATGLELLLHLNATILFGSLQESTTKDPKEEGYLMRTLELYNHFNWQHSAYQEHSP